VRSCALAGVLRCMRLVASVLFVLVGCAPQGAVVEPVAGVDAAAVLAAPEVLPVDLSSEAVQALYAEGEIVIIDVREPSAYAQGHIPGAALIPLGELSGRLEEVPRDQAVVLVCRSGNRSRQALQILGAEGFEDIHNLLGGMNAWSRAGYEVVQ